MKRFFLVLAFVLTMVIGASAQDTAKKVNFYVGAGAGLPMGDFGDGYGTGLNGFAGIGFNVAPSFQILGKVEYHTFGMDEAIRDAFAELLGTGTVSNVDGGNFNAIMFGADGKFNFKMQNPKFTPYLIGGLGMAALSMKDITFDDDNGSNTVAFDSETKFYFEAGAGFDLAAGDAMSIFLQARYVSIATEGFSSTFIPFTVGLKF